RRARTPAITIGDTSRDRSNDIWQRNWRRWSKSPTECLNRCHPMKPTPLLPKKTGAFSAPVQRWLVRPDKTCCVGRTLLSDLIPPLPRVPHSKFAALGEFRGGELRTTPSFLVSASNP